jgi:hypothetical protein
VDRDTSVSRTLTVAPGSLARKHALSRERRVRAPRSCWALQRHASTRAVRGPCEDAELQTCGATAAGEMKRRATQQYPRRQIAMMARHFTAGRCADAPVLALGLDALMPVAPFKCSLLDALDTSPASSNTTSSSDTSPSDGSFCLLRRRIRELRGETPRAPPGQPEQDEGSRPVDARSRRPPAHWGAAVGRCNHAAPGTSIALTLRGPTLGGALNAPSPVATTTQAPRPAGSIDRALREVEAALGPLPPVADASGP